MWLEDFLNNLAVNVADMLPRIAGAIIALIIGWIAGKALGKAVSKLLDKAGVDDALRKTLVGKTLERSGISCVSFFDLIVRWFIYLIAIFAAVDILQIEVLSYYMNMVVSYLPSFIAGIVIFVAGFIIIDYVADFIRKLGEEADIAYSRIFADGLRLFLYGVVTILALSQMKVDVSILYIFANALAWGLAIGIGVGLGIAIGWGFKDAIAENSKKWIKSWTKTIEKLEETRTKEKEETEE
jgi:small-conductance mechanosensitive channel